MSSISKGSRSGWCWVQKRSLIAKDWLLQISTGSNRSTKTRSRPKCRFAIDHPRFPVLFGESSKEVPKFVSQKILRRLHRGRQRCFIVAIRSWVEDGSSERSASASRLQISNVRSQSSDILRFEICYSERSEDCHYNLGLQNQSV